MRFVLCVRRKREAMQTVIRILESVQLKWEHFQTWTEFSRLHLSNKLAIFGVGYNTRWRDDVRYHHAEISSQVPLGKRLREYFNPEKTEGRAIMTKVQKMNWKNVYYKFLDITISEARCLELHMETEWTYVAQSKLAGCGAGTSHYLLPTDIPKTYGLYAIGYEELSPSNDTEHTSDLIPEDHSFPRPENGARGDERTGVKVTYCYLGVADDRTIQQCLFQHFQGSAKHHSPGDAGGVTQLLQENSRPDGGQNPSRHVAIYIKFIEVELDFLSAGSLVECLETAIGYSLKYNNNRHAS